MDKDTKSVIHRINAVTEGYPRGINLGKDDLAVLCWIFFYETEGTGSRAVADEELRWLIRQAAKDLELEMQATQINAVIQRLMRLGLLRLTFSDSRNSAYQLTRLGSSLARELVEDADYGSEELNVLLESAHLAVQRKMDEGRMDLAKYLEHVFLGTIRQKLELKVHGMEEDLERRKKDVGISYSGRSERDFEDAVNNIEYCRMALTELVDAVQESSACVRLEHLLYERIDSGDDPALNDLLEKSVSFLYTLRGRIDGMLKSVIVFIQDCIAFRSLAVTLDSRDRLCRIQERILSHALEGVLRIPVLAAPVLPRLEIQWSSQVRQRPVFLNREHMDELDDFTPLEIPPVEPRWKNGFLATARQGWQAVTRMGGMDLCRWLNELAGESSEWLENPSLALWYLVQDWSTWTPAVRVEHRKGDWAPLGEEWMMETADIKPAAPDPSRNAGRMVPDPTDPSDPTDRSDMISKQQCNG